MSFIKTLFFLLLALFCIESAFAKCDSGLKLGAAHSKAEEKFGSGTHYSDNLSVISILAKDICPGEDLGDATLEITFLNGSAVSFVFIVNNGQENAESKKMKLFNYVERNYGKITSNNNPKDWTGFTTFKEGADGVVVYKKMYFQKTILEEELYISTIKLTDKLVSEIALAEEGMDDDDES